MICKVIAKNSYLVVEDTYFRLSSHKDCLMAQGLQIHGCFCDGSWKSMNRENEFPSAEFANSVHVVRC